MVELWIVAGCALFITLMCGVTICSRFHYINKAEKSGRDADRYRTDLKYSEERNESYAKEILALKAAMKAEKDLAWQAMNKVNAAFAELGVR